MKFFFLLFACFSVIHAGVETYFKTAENKPKPNGIALIDFIYVINLDKRPERYEQTLRALEPFGITPYRFSAVNGNCFQRL